MANTVPGTEAVDGDRVGGGARGEGDSVPRRLGPSQEGEEGQTAGLRVASSVPPLAATVRLPSRFPDPVLLRCRHRRWLVPQRCSVFQVFNGYFVHFFAPDNMDPIPKNILFVIDVSGSMWGIKMKQVSAPWRRW